MVSGLVTSPCDQLRIFSGEARLMRMASKSAIGFARSKGLERNKVSSTLAAFIAAASGPEPNQPGYPPCRVSCDRGTLSILPKAREPGAHGRSSNTLNHYAAADPPPSAVGG